MLNIDEDKLRLLLANRKSKIERPKYSGIGEVISGISIIFTLCLADFGQVKIMKPLLFQVVAWVLALAILFFGIFLFAKSIIKFYSVDDLYNEIAYLDPNVEHPFNIILIKNSREEGKYLLFKSKRWKCLLFPNYHCLSGGYNLDAEKSCIREYLRRDINASGDIDIEYLGEKVSCKYSVYDKIDKKYKFHYFCITNITIPNAKKRFFKFNGKKYVWKSLDQMYANKNIVKKNQDVLDYVRMTCEIN